MTPEQLATYFADNQNQILADWEALLRFPSISTDEAHAANCLNCANWLTDYLKASGFAAQQLATPTKPVVYAERSGAPGAPVVLLYGH